MNQIIRYVYIDDDRKVLVEESFIDLICTEERTNIRLVIEILEK